MAYTLLFINEKFRTILLIPPPPIKLGAIIQVCFVSDDMEVTQEPDFDVGELSSTRRQVEVQLGGAVQLACPPGSYILLLEKR